MCERKGSFGGVTQEVGARVGGREKRRGAAGGREAREGQRGGQSQGDSDRSVAQPRLASAPTQRAPGPPAHSPACCLSSHLLLLVFVGHQVPSLDSGFEICLCLLHF